MHLISGFSYSTPSSINLLFQASCLGECVSSSLDSGVQRPTQSFHPFMPRVWRDVYRHKKIIPTRLWDPPRAHTEGVVPIGRPIMCPRRGCGLCVMFKVMEPYP